MILHIADAAQQGVKRIVVICRDTDVLVHLVHHYEHLIREVWMRAGTAKEPRVININSLVVDLFEPVKKNLPA